MIVLPQFVWMIHVFSLGELYFCSLFFRSVDGTIRTYDVRAGMLYQEKMQGMFKIDYTIVPICSVSLSRDNQCIVASTTSSSIAVFERVKGMLLNELFSIFSVN